MSPIAAFPALYHFVWKEAGNGDNDPSSGNGSIVIVDSRPDPATGNIPCAVRFDWGCFRAIFRTSWLSASDTFDHFNCVLITPFMREELGWDLILKVGGIDDRGYELLVVSIDLGTLGGGPCELLLYAKRWVGEAEDMELSYEEKRELRIELYEGQNQEEDDEARNDEEAREEQ
ncbi:MAG: hypothetical protein LQ346_002183 [Caloplaca aetnensis]|nr:MAG: hypothetical protein LQ346_002183 [Caloplaca aetnensis]